MDRNSIKGSTIKDVAEMAGVSSATVSHVINSTRYVSDDLTQRVNNAINELEYQPNVIARSLRGGGTKSIGLIVPDNSNPFFAQVARVIEDKGFGEGYSVILCNSNGDIQKEAAYIQILIAKHVDGVIFIASSNAYEHLQMLSNQNIPMVVVDREISNLSVDSFHVTNEQGGYDATCYLLSLGHKKIGCITGPSNLTPSAERVNGYRRALIEAVISVREDYIVTGNFRFQGGTSAMNRLLELPDPPTAVFVCNDVMAIGALQSLRNRNVRVPEDMSIIGFDDIELASAVSPKLTTIQQPIVELGTQIVKTLIERIKQNDEKNRGTRNILNTTLVIRESCAPPCL